MKKTIITLFSIMLLAAGTIAISRATENCPTPAKVRDIIEKYDHYKGVEAINIGSFLINLAKLSGEKEFDYCDRISILSAEADEVNAKTMRSLQREMEATLLNYTKIMEMNDGDEQAHIFTIQKNEHYITDLVIFVTENDEIAVISIEGKIPVEEINYLIHKYND